ncbi:MAG: tetratricopeptide repeat protein [Burkholderiales bacterium]|nr:tetratricopeptide repeat protein [Burkholderiales bacterium]
MLGRLLRSIAWRGPGAGRKGEVRDGGAQHASAQAWYERIQGHVRRGEQDLALELSAAALRAHPDNLALHVNCACLAKNANRLEMARQLLQRAIRIDPGSAEAWYNLGVLLQETRYLDEALEAFERALALLRERGDSGLLRSVALTMGLALQNAGDWEGSRRLLEHIAKSRPEIAADCLQVALYAHMVAAGARPQSCLAAHRLWAERYLPVAAAGAGIEVERDPDRVLRVGYLSGDFFAHAVSWFVEPVLAGHDRRRFAVYCYNNSAYADATTERLSKYPAAWRSVSALDDGALCERIRADRIDILVDLSGHTARNRLAALARRPAPIQMTWLGSRATSGMAQIDFRLSDAVVDPPGISEPWYVERILRLPDSQWCFAPPEDCPDPGPLPMRAAGHVTFGSFNQFEKINEGVVTAWSRILHGVPGARLLVASVPNGRLRERFLAAWARHGIGAERLDLTGYTTRAEFQALHRRADIALDPFPCNGATTTCESPWMGLPVVVLEGDWGVARAGASILGAAGLREWIARSADAYVRCAVEAAREPQALARLRAQMRERLLASALMDGARFVRGLEECLRGAWRQYCAARPAGARTSSGADAQGPIPGEAAP